MSSGVTIGDGDTMKQIWRHKIRMRKQIIRSGVTICDGGIEKLWRYDCIFQLSGVAIDDGGSGVTIGNGGTE